MARWKITPQLQEMEERYFRLVWYARSRPEDYAVAERGLKEVEFLFPGEVEELKGADSNWHHGFNSGMLAALRFMLSCQEHGLEHAREEFPELDT